MTDLDEPPVLSVLLDGFELSAREAEEARALPAEVEEWLRDRTAGWSDQQMAMLAAQLRAKWTALKRTEWRADPVLWSREVAKATLWSKQREILDAVKTHTRVAVPSCHGAGKTFTAADLTAWWLSVHEPGTAFVVSTAPTFAQVRAVLWREINKLHKRAKLGGHVNQTEWHIEGELVGFGRKPADTDESAFQGLHGDHMLVLIDEAGGVPEQLWVAAEAIAVGDGDRIVAFGNPDDPSAHFAKVCRPDNPLWHTIHISALETPNLTGEQMDGGVPGGMVSRRYVEEAKVNWGEDSPLYVSKVLGQFPEFDQFSTVRPGDVAFCRTGLELTPSQLLPVELGVDVGGGGDLTAIRARHGARAGRSWTAKTPEPEHVVALILQAIIDTPDVSAVKIDIGGIGWGIAASLRAALDVAGLSQINVVPVNFGWAATDPMRLKNVRAELWWDIGRQLSQDHAWDLKAVDETTIAQLLTPRWSADKVGRIVIESKEDVIKRTGRSPDEADALLLAFWVGAVFETSVEVPTGTIPIGASALTR
ncbi:MAG: hypothetical protein JWO15_3751 [Sphingomonadales bacterium]|nr:hypothetical protein [Sphingomonadales bacterium]